MQARWTTRKQGSQTGIALLISIFILLLISVVAIALIVSSGTESALAGNYRSSTDVYYAALAGLEEARGRLLPKNPNSFQATAPSMLPPPGARFDMGYVSYITNPVGTEDVLAIYPDTEYDTEPYTVPRASAIVNSTPSVSGVGGVQGPLYKWVRINAVSELSLKVDVDSDGTKDDNPLYYDGTRFTTNPSAGAQVFEITSFAMLPNKRQKILQYLVAPIPLNFQAGLTLDGDTPKFKAPTSPSFWVRGGDQGSVGTCNPNPSSTASAVGYTTGSLSNFVQPTNPSGILAGPSPSPDLRNHYTPVVGSNPDIVQVTLSPNLQTVAGLNALVQTIQQNADLVINGNVCVGSSCSIQADLPAAMSASNPMTIVINGDLKFSGWHSTGYGLLLVTGQFTYDPDASWDGIILVIGKGLMDSYQGASTTTQILGAVLLARTLYPEPSTVPLPPSSPPGSPNFDFTNSSSANIFGISYSSCWIQASIANLGYKILSFHEISQ